MLNKVTLIGNLGQDPQLKTLDSGSKVASFSLATSETYKDKHSGERKKSTQWHNIVCWDHLAELASKYLYKGSKVFIEGKLKTRSYQTIDGKRMTTEVVVSELLFLDSKSNNSEMEEMDKPAEVDESDIYPFA